MVTIFRVPASDTKSPPASINLRKPDSCCNCVHNKSGYVSVDCDMHPVRVAGYAFELVCNDHDKMEDS